MSQTLAIISIIIAAVIVLALWISTRVGNQTPYRKAIESLPVSAGPIRHEELPRELVSRIVRLQPIFSEVYPISRDEWLDGFQRDLNPEPEVRKWEHMAAAFSEFLASNELDERARKEVFSLLLLRSTGDDIEPYLENLKSLSQEQARTVVALYRLPPTPVTVGLIE